MTITSVLAVVVVTDAKAAQPWYEQVLGKPADLTPMPSLAEWRLADGGWLQVVSDAGQPGASMLTLEVDDLDATMAQLRERGVDIDEMDLGDRDDSLRLAQVTDPDGNVVTFAEALVGH